MTVISIEMEILLRSMQWEEEGYYLYKSLSCRFADSRQKEFFLNLADEEFEHQKWLEDKLKEECKERKINFDQVINVELKDLTFKPLARTPFKNDDHVNHFPDPLTFPISFEYAIGHEHKTIEIYEELLGFVSAGSTGFLIKKLIEQEKEHIELLQVEKARLTLV